ncbi:MAG: hypothetical protein JWN73_3681 [Betaproteobacteria bacterium]|nr:hypothetical protein [Betaproteobacteria bacterium]
MARQQGRCYDAAVPLQSDLKRMPQIEGSYTRYGGLRRLYSFKLIYGGSGGRVHWSVIVSHEGVVKGNPSGAFEAKMQDPADVRMQAVDHAMAAIESLSEMQE